MSALDRGIGSEGLEQGGPNLGNDYSRKDLSIRDAGSALTTPNTQGSGNQDDDTLNMDKESSRNLSGSAIEPDEDDLEIEDEDLDDDDLEDDDDLVDEDEEDDELDRGL